MTIVTKLITAPESVRTECLIILLTSDGKLSKVAKPINKATAGALKKLMSRGDITGKVGEALMLPITSAINAERILLLGCGDSKNLSSSDFRKLIDTLLRQLNQHKVKEACWLLDDLKVKDRDQAWLLQQLAMRCGLNTYSYSETLSKPKPAPALRKLTLSFKSDKTLQAAIAQGNAIALGMNIARELGDLPGNICTPTYLASRAKTLARKHKALSVSILEEKRMRELGMGALLSVTAGTEQPAKLIVLEYRGAAKSKKPHALVGKGITFDSGGISIKPGARMDEMKYDMCGAASVIGTLAAVATLKLPINVIAVIAAAENMPSGTATKPGDVVTSMSGQTIEVLNTDAEGRLVLCDALSYVARYQPQSIIDIATLTGACVVALGKHASAVYSNSDDFAAEILAAGEAIGDRGWHMPLWEEYQAQLHSNFADIANIGGPDAGSVTAACFLSRFTKDQRWAHLDIAGTAWDSGANKGATGRPVGLLTRYLINKS